MDKDGVVFSTADPLGRTVRLRRTTWDAHIVKGHPEMANNESAVQQAVEYPLVIYRSSWKPDTSLFFAKVSESSYPHLYTRVVVGYDGNNEGNVETALFSKTIGGISEEGLLYVRSKR